MIYSYRVFTAFRFLLIISAMLLISGEAFSDIDGRTGRTLKSSANGCGGCHGSRDASVSVLISGQSAVTTSHTYTFSVTINKAGKTGAGVDIAVRRGVLGIVSPTLHLQSSELAHNNNIPMTGGQVTLQFSYTSPATAGTDTIFVTGNATNSDGNESGDSWNWATSFRIDVSPPPKVLHLTELIEGFYNTSTGLMNGDTVRVYLRNNFAPYALIDSSTSYIDPSGKGNFSFTHASNALPYYIVLRHRNSVETWSSSGQSFSGDSLSYNFTTSSATAYGNNLKLVGTKYCNFGGDVNQDGFVDLTDITLVYNDAVTFVTGYKPADVTGDNLIDLTDIVLTYNNSAAFVSLQRPF
ncbi:MAG: hypothetical protein IPL53_14235 [Ignavibacteria bacterium]|nr:hypothetical protein [Ignavibacteria bacterium]